MKTKIVVDSSSDVLNITGVDFESVPLTILTDNKEYVDDINLDVDGMVKDLREYNGKSHTSCPNTGRWLQSFEGYDEIYVITITSKLSGSYNSAMVAKNMYLEENPETKIHVFDSLSTGPEMKLLIEKLIELINSGYDFENVVEMGKKYLSSTELFFSLESLHNLAQNGRVSKISEVAARILNIRVVGKAQEGVLHVLNKCRGLKKTFSTLIEHMSFAKYNGGKIRIAHVNNLDFAIKIKNFILEKFQNADIEIYKSRGLCSFYAEEGGLLIGIETA